MKTKKIFKFLALAAVIAAIAYVHQTTAKWSLEGKVKKLDNAIQNGDASLFFLAGDIFHLNNVYDAETLGMAYEELVRIEWSKARAKNDLKLAKAEEKTWREPQEVGIVRKFHAEAVERKEMVEQKLAFLETQKDSVMLIFADLLQKAQKDEPAKASEENRFSARELRDVQTKLDILMETPGNPFAQTQKIFNISDSTKTLKLVNLLIDAVYTKEKSLKEQTKIKFHTEINTKMFASRKYPPTELESKHIERLIKAREVNCEHKLAIVEREEAESIEKIAIKVLLLLKS
ncbi:MAG: hypothetical protein LBR70_03755 [Lactobacillaceae bacterium]|jgi:hypothetical protein|nr:hypothetical protein [Lactobacillaceae bacterium]